MPLALQSLFLLFQQLVLWDIFSVFKLMQSALLIVFLPRGLIASVLHVVNSLSEKIWVLFHEFGSDLLQRDASRIVVGREFSDFVLVGFFVGFKLFSLILEILLIIAQLHNIKLRLFQF